ncbi:hypothetical protein AVEN_16036-1 [Araneus ventricosus]|uniref:Uncharacterized protein n=1 Tax=Araneus ventricosus TaxID=182803 RepID=A0A4Y2Q2M3_ARAVE|nr:hypothetical protein AVEN_16036-1 [Araneus ventricosus]
MRSLSTQRNQCRRQSYRRSYRLRNKIAGDGATSLSHGALLGPPSGSRGRTTINSNTDPFSVWETCLLALMIFIFLFLPKNTFCPAELHGACATGPVEQNQQSDAPRRPFSGCYGHR